MTDQGIFQRFKSLFPSRGEQVEIRLHEPYRLGNERLRVIHGNAPLQVSLQRAGLELLLCPEISLNEKTEPPSFQLFDSSRCRTGISGFMRLEGKGDSLVIGHHDKRQVLMFEYPDSMDLRRLRITHDGDALLFKALVSDSDIRLSQLPQQDEFLLLLRERRRDRLRRIREIFGGEIRVLDPQAALETLRAVNGILAEEAYRPLDERGRPGGVLRLPRSLTPIVVGDLHAQVDNLLTLLSQNSFLEALESGDAALVLLGDAVHSERDGELDRMDDSLLMMDLILRLKLRFPRQVFYLRGNHDSFSDSVFKFGVAQCLLWESTLRRIRGEAYLVEMDRFYSRLPYLLLSEDYVATHAAPVKTRFNLEMLINIHRYPGLVQELTRNRIRRRDLPAGYTARDVKHFLEALGLAEDTTFLVSHSPLDREHALWPNAAGIENHHIVFSANIPWIGVFTRVGGRMVPLSYRRESLLPVVNAL